MSELTVVTAFFDLKKREPEVDRRDASFYLNNSKVLSILANLVIYVDEEWYETVSEKCKSRKEGTTHIIPVQLEELGPYSCLPALKENYIKNRIIDSNPAKDTPLYMCAMRCKYYLMHRALTDNVFSSKFFSWIDFGIGYAADFTYVEEALAYRPLRFRTTMLNHYSARDAPDDIYYKRLPWIATGNFSLAPYEHMVNHCIWFDYEYSRAIQLGYCPTDEQVTGKVIINHPDNYEFAIGDYGSVFSNFAGVVRANAERVQAVNEQTRSDKYGYSRIPFFDDEYNKVFRQNYHHFVELQNLCRITGCGSYLIDGATLDYCPLMYDKQRDLFETAKTASNVLEVGVYAGSSALIMLMANPLLQYTGIDICEYEFTEKCICYLQDAFPGRVQFIRGNSVDAMQGLDLQTYDMVHLDGDHGSIIKQETAMVLKAGNKNVQIVYDDYDSSGVQETLREFTQLHIIRIANCSWRNCRTRILSSLDDLAIKYDTDKSPHRKKHYYTLKYEKLFGERRNSVKKVLEIGIGYPELMGGTHYVAGASLYMWRDYFPEAQIYGADIKKDTLFQADRITTLYCDQSDRASLLDLTVYAPFDIIIDDGSHEFNHQLLTLGILLQYLAPGGIYVIEDVKTEYMKQFAGLRPTNVTVDIEDSSTYQLSLGYTNHIDDNLVIYKKTGVHPS